jgi:hypothetical protein
VDAAKQVKSGRACIGDHLFIGVADSKSKVASEQVKLLSSAELSDKRLLLYQYCRMTQKSMRSH